MGIYQIIATPDADTCTVSVRCLSCQAKETFNVSYKAFVAWERGELIQEALPELSLGQREILISNTCGECFDGMFKNIEDED